MTKEFLIPIIDEIWWEKSKLPRPRNRKIDAARNIAICVRFFVKGEKLVPLAKSYGVTRSRISQILRETKAAIEPRYDLFLGRKK